MFHRRAGALASVGAAAVSLAIAVSASAAVAAPGSGRSQLRNSNSPAAAHTPRVGSVGGGTQMHFQVELKLADQTGAQAFAQAVSTPGGASYGQYLTPAQWESRFSPTAASVAEVQSFLRGNGFTVDGVSGDRMSVRASGTASQVQRAFATSLSYHRVQGDTLLLADTDLSVPSAVAGVVAGVTGVSDTHAQPDSTTGGPAPAATAAYQQPAGFRTPQPCGAYYGQIFDTALPQYPGYGSNPPWDVCGYTGPQLRSAYGLTGPNDGNGVTVAIIDAYESPTLLSDAHRFSAVNDPGNALRASQFSEIQAKSFTQGGPNKCDASGWYGEQTLDVEAVHDTAPGASILYAGAKNCNDGPLNTMLRRIVDGHLANVVTNSYGDDGGDVLDSADDRAATDNILLMAAGTGVSVMFSSGDDGDEYTTIGQVAADYPSSSPWATAVGGTSLEIGRFGQRLGEYGWSTANSYYCNAAYVAAGGCTASQLGTWLPIGLALDGGSGGGTSAVYPQPPYQRGVVPAALSQRNGATPMRVEPDVSMDADPSTGMLEGETQTFPDGTYYDQYRIGGTSVASPLLAGVVARADETAGHPLGFLNPRLYSLYGGRSASGGGSLLDVLPTHQDMSRADYVNSVDASQGFEYQTRIVDYEGTEEYCTTATPPVCSQRPVALNTAPGFDSMTGLGSPGDGFVQTLGARR